MPMACTMQAMPRRLLQLYAGLVLYGLSMALQVQATLGLGPWDVFHEGVAERTGLTFGTVVIITSVAVLALWIPLRQKPGVGTISNVLVVGLAADAGLALIPEGGPLGVRLAMLATAVLLNAVAGAAYLGAKLGPGARDGLMTGLVERTGGSVAKIRTGIEVSVMVIGFALGGTVGPGTILYAVSIGPLLQALMPSFTRPAPAPA
jgi:uncharacterized membrane protein YczE